MTRKIITALVLSGSMALCPPASAQDEIAGASGGSEHVAGARVDMAADGFQLVTHGLWAPPTALQERPSLPATEAKRRVDISHPRKVPRTKTSFRRAAFLPHIYAAEARYGLPSGLLDALIWTESRYNPIAVSGAGAAGLGQLMPRTARDLGVADRFDPRANILGAARYLKQLLDKFGVVHLAIAAYNAGPGAVERARGIPLNGETPGYVRSVMEFWGAK